MASTNREKGVAGALLGLCALLGLQHVSASSALADRPDPNRWIPLLLDPGTPNELLSRAPTTSNGILTDAPRTPQSPNATVLDSQNLDVETHRSPMVSVPLAKMDEKSNGGFFLFSWIKKAVDVVSSAVTSIAGWVSDFVSPDDAKRYAKLARDGDITPAQLLEVAAREPDWSDKQRERFATALNETPKGFQTLSTLDAMGSWEIADNAVGDLYQDVGACVAKALAVDQLTPNTDWSGFNDEEWETCYRTLHIRFRLYDQKRAALAGDITPNGIRETWNKLQGWNRDDAAAFLMDLTRTPMGARTALILYDMLQDSWDTEDAFKDFFKEKGSDEEPGGTYREIAELKKKHTLATSSSAPRRRTIAEIYDALGQCLVEASEGGTLTAETAWSEINQQKWIACARHQFLESKSL